jgi:hypothetical protein
MMSTNNNHFGADDPVEAIVERAYMEAGYVKETEDSARIPDPDLMKARTFEIVKEKVVSDPKHKSAKSISQGELYAAVFPGGPGADPDGNIDELPPEEYEARSKLVRRVWNLTNPGRQGYIQKRLGDQSSLVLCRTMIMRDLDEVKGCYVTDHPDLIMVDSLRPQVEALVRQANNLARHFDMLGARHPELEARMLGELGTGMKKAAAALPSGSDEPGSEGKKEAGS